MPYSFDAPLLLALQIAFEKARVRSEPLNYADLKTKDYFFIHFETPISLAFEDEHNNPNLIDQLFIGDNRLSEHCDEALKPLGLSLSFGFRWCGAYQDHKKTIQLQGAALKTRYLDNKNMDRQVIFGVLCHACREAQLISDPVSFLKKLNAVAPPSLTYHLYRSRFFKREALSHVTSEQLQAREAWIGEKIPPILNAYHRENERGMNPAYQAISQVRCSLAVHQKKIWVLRSDFILAVGNKNAYWINFKEDGLSTAIERRLHQHIDWDDRYGHPSLAIPEGSFDGSIFYGGYLAQRRTHLEVYLFTGRFQRYDLDHEAQHHLETYLAYQFQQAYGHQTVIFIDAVLPRDPSHPLSCFDLSIFHHDQELPDYCTRRTYHAEDIDDELRLVC